MAPQDHNSAERNGESPRTHLREDPLTLDDLEDIAQKRLPQVAWDFYANGADDEKALRRNVAAYDDVLILPRVLRDVSAIDTSTQIWGRKMPMPLAIAPSAMQKMAGGDGEADTARAALKMGLTMGLSSQSTTALEEVIGCAREPKADPSSLTKFWFQLYLTTDEERNLSLIQRAEAAGYEALVLTVDAPILGNRIRERRTPVVLPSHLSLANYKQSPGSEGKPHDSRMLSEGKPSWNRMLMDARSAKEEAAVRKAAGTGIINPATTWEDVKRLRQMTKVKIILKGIMSPDDATLAVQYGVDAIVISNHGGRQLDCTLSTFEAIPEVAAAVKGQLPIIVDGGIRRGSDIFKALCLGADLVLIGRPVLWGLAFNGEAGVTTVLNILEREFSRTMALAGVTKVSDINSSYLRLKRDLLAAKL